MIRVKKKRVKYVLIIPRWRLLVILIKGALARAIAFGPDFSNQVWSTIWVEMDCPMIRFNLGASRWMAEGTYPSRLEKWCACRLGRVLSCLLVREASSRATKTPIIVTARAASFRVKGMDAIGVLGGRIFEMRRRPATMLPQANRLIGLITVGLFSLIGDRGLNRG